MNDYNYRTGNPSWINDRKTGVGSTDGGGNVRTNGCIESERQPMKWLLAFSCRGSDAGEGNLKVPKRKGRW